MMKSLTKKESLTAIGVYLFFTVIAFISNFTFDNFRFTTLIFYLIVGVGVLVAAKVFSDKKTANAAVGAALTACVCFNFFSNALMMEAVGIEGRLKTLGALALFICALILVFLKKTVFTVPIPVAMIFLNERFAIITAVMLLCCAVISLMFEKKKTPGIVLTVCFALVCAGAFVYSFMFSDVIFNYADNIINVIDSNRNIFALATAQIIVLVLAFKKKCKSKITLLISYLLIFAVDIIGCLHFEIGYLTYAFFAVGSAVLCAMSYDSQLRNSAKEFIENNKALSIVIFLMALV